MADNAPLFRKAATDQLSSPDELDRALRVTGPRAWLALGALASVVCILLAWSVFGGVPTDVRGDGILLHTDGVTPVVATTSGRLRGLVVRPGDMVRRGQLLATVMQPILAAQREQAVAAYEAAGRQQADLARFQALDGIEQLAVFRRQRDDATRTMTDADAQAQWYEERLASEAALVAQRLVADDKPFEMRRSALAERARAEVASTRLREISLAEAAWRHRTEQDRIKVQLEVEKAGRDVAALTVQLREAAEITSSDDGRVVEVLAVDGQMTTAGEPVLRLEGITGPLEAIVYLPAADGKKVKAGMSVRISPSTVRPEEFGYITGTVRSVSGFPATAKAMQRLLQHEGLVTALSGKGTPFEVRVTLEPNDKAASGYRWTSGRGPDLQLMSGTLASALVTERTQRPIELVLPFVRSLFGP